MSAAEREWLRIFAPLALMALPAWGLLGLSAGSDALPAFCLSSLLWSVPSPGQFGVFFAFVPPWKLALGWVLMVAAMMLPMLSGPLGYVRQRSFRAASARLEALVIAGYAAVWMAAGAIIMALALTLRLASGGGSGGFALALAVALVWQVSAWKQAALNRCHRRPTLAAFAPAAYRDAVLFGASHGLWCVSACWALMLASLTVPAHHVAGMAIVAIFNWSERLEAPRTTRWRLRAPTVAARLAVRLIGRVATPVSKLPTYRRSTAVLGTSGPQKGPK